MSPVHDKKNLKTVLITGGGSGIGLETAKLLLSKKIYRLILIGKDKYKLQDALKTLAASPDEVSFFPCDLREPAQIKRTIDKIITTHKEIYALINNAGIYPFGGVTTTTETIWNEAFAINLKAPFLLIQGLAAKMAKNSNGGRIVNVASTAGILPNHFALAYSVSKAALIHLTRTLAKELGKDNITVNCVCPGIVRSPLHVAYHPNESSLEDFYAKKGATFPLGRIGEPKDVAHAIDFFLSEDSGWITGDTSVVDGGRLLL